MRVIGRHLSKLLAIAGLGFSLAACQTTASLHDSLKSKPLVRDGSARVVVMTPDIELFEVQASGLKRPMADWTAAANKHVRAALEQCLEEVKLNRVAFRTEGLDAEARQRVERLNNLHAAVSSSIVAHQLLPQFHLPNKVNKFDWSLGPGAASIGESHEARYGLYLHIRDYYASADRAAMVAATVIIGALAGVAVAPAGGVQVGYASLVDLETGDILWFNKLQRGQGDLRKATPALETIATILGNFPYGQCTPPPSEDEQV